MPYLLLWLSLVFILASTAPAQSIEHSTKLAVLDFGSAAFGREVATKFRADFRARPDFKLLDPDLSGTAARGIGYSGSLNMSVSDARDLGAAMDSEFYIIGDAQTLRRSSSQNPVYYESYASVFVISTRTGNLIFWDRLHSESDNASVAEEKLIKTLTEQNEAQLCVDAIRKAEQAEMNQRMLVLTVNTPIIQEAPEDDMSAAARELQLPRPYRRIRPEYPETAAIADAEATVDVLVDVGADGEVNQVQLARWAGFGLDETTIATVRQLHFFPAKRNGISIPMRVLLRYNFRKPSQ